MIVWSFGAIFVLHNIQKELNSYVSTIKYIEDLHRRRLAEERIKTPTSPTS